MIYHISEKISSGTKKTQTNKKKIIRETRESKWELVVIWLDFQTDWAYLKDTCTRKDKDSLLEHLDHIHLRCLCLDKMYNINYIVLSSDENVC